MPTVNAAVDAYIAKSAPFAQPILIHLREIVHEAAPDVEEAMKWSRPFFMYRGVILGNISAFKEHCSFGLWGTEIAEILRAEGIASSEGMGTFGRIASLKNLPPRKKLVSYVKQAAKMIDEGVRTKSLSMRPRVAKLPVDVPEALTAALKKNKAAAKKFEAMSPSCRREYSEWIAEAKREETRDKRIATALEWIAEGKSRNWKYEKSSAWQVD
ncbi:YdeI/OmpD-associated family protein [Granulicella sp. S156]|jgi:uncharacterized protein YdeI (YjbR/CyaY-like superfamily)|uniref:YdeI/OmpD-associated family protein n=1 Tax=Granulicella sp. S156 TaxID=1747224 RepID=UPI00131DFCED|nr:YdeI/OmpD-associated family protein [Granulicella sp. S156]